MAKKKKAARAELERFVGVNMHGERSEVPQWKILFDGVLVGYVCAAAGAPINTLPTAVVLTGSDVAEVESLVEKQLGERRKLSTRLTAQQLGRQVEALTSADEEDMGDDG